jgi:hypothetical protein
LVYGVEDDALIVMVMAVDKREDAVVYAAARARLGERAKELAKRSQKGLTRLPKSEGPNGLDHR